MILFGASGHGKSIIDIAQSIGEPITHIYDDNPPAQSVCNIRVYKFDPRAVHPNEKWIIGIGNNMVRKAVKSRLNVKFGTLIHISASISKWATLGEGSVVMAQVVINASANVGSHCIINSSSVVEHDCKLGDFVHISPNATIAGGVEIGEGSHIGIGACVLPYISIGKWATIGAGAVIIKNVPDGAVVVGNPGRIIK